MATDNFILSTTQLLDDFQVKAYLGVINANVVLGTNFFSEFAASFTDMFGGRSETYQRKLDIMYESAQKELIKKAKQIGANAILGFRTNFDEISGKGKSMFMLTATGTACRVETEQTVTNHVISNIAIGLEKLNSEILKDKIIKKFENKNYVFTDDEWSYMAEKPTKDIAELLLKLVYYRVEEDIRLRIEHIINQLDYDEAVSVVYPLYEKPYEVKALVLDYNVVANENKDISSIYYTVIKHCKLFSPVRVLSLIDNNLNKAIRILDSDKSYYTREDLKEMQNICAKFDNLPDKGKIEMAKSGMFSKTEKEFFFCPNNHKNECPMDFCPNCGLNIKGLKEEQVKLINVFKRRTEILQKLLQAQ